MSVGAGAYRRSGFRRRGLWIAAPLVVAFLIVADRNGWLLMRQSDDIKTYHGVHAKVLRVIDGDTIEVDIPDALHHKSSTRVGLWGVNCPEQARAGRPAEPWAAEAAELTTARALNNVVTLWLESHQTRDGFGRVLAHVELPDGTKLNEALLEAGLAKVDDRVPHSMLTRYAQVEMAAQRRAVGVWAKAERR